MGYLDNSSITVDAILTLKGRELLSKGDGSFNIVSFALGDDEIDYKLWNTDAPGGTDDYGILIENLPITEAIPDETQALRYKLITLPIGSQYIPNIIVGSSNITLNYNTNDTIEPNTTLGGNSTYGYTATIADQSVATLETLTQVPGNVAPSSFGIFGNQSFSTVGFSFKVTGKQLTETTSTTITIVGNETGGSVTINLTVNEYSIAVGGTGGSTTQVI
jgi:hypothetical protein